MFIVKYALKFVKILSKNESPQRIGAGIALGAILGITPLKSLHNLPVIFLIIILPVNHTSAIFSLGFFTLFAYVIDPISNLIGHYLLVNMSFLRPLWTSLYNIPVVPWTKFNNTLTLGSLIFSLALFLPLYFFMVWFIKYYRSMLQDHIQKWKIIQILKSSKLYQMYRSYS